MCSKLEYLVGALEVKLKPLRPLLALHQLLFKLINFDDFVIKPLFHDLEILLLCFVLLFQVTFPQLNFFLLFIQFLYLIFEFILKLYLCFDFLLCFLDLSIADGNFLSRLVKLFGQSLNLPFHVLFFHLVHILCFILLAHVLSLRLFNLNLHVRYLSLESLFLLVAFRRQFVNLLLLIQVFGRHYSILRH